MAASGMIFLALAVAMSAATCPDFAPDKRFKPKSIMNTWNLYEVRAVNPKVNSLKCAQISFSQDNDVVRMKVSGTNLDGTPYMQKGVLTTPDIKIPAVMTINYEGVPGLQQVMVLDTDEDTYLVLGSCFVADDQPKIHISIMTRGHFSADAKMDSVYNKLSKYGIDPENLYKLPKTGC